MKFCPLGYFCIVSMHLYLVKLCLEYEGLCIISDKVCAEFRDENGVSMGPHWTCPIENEKIHIPIDKFSLDMSKRAFRHVHSHL